MRWRSVVDAIFPHVEPQEPAQVAVDAQRLNHDVAAISAAVWKPEEARALDEAPRVATAEAERVKTAEAKATTYLAVLAALVPVVITLQGASWEKKAGPAPETLHIIVLAVATVYVAAAGYHAFKTLQVTGFQRVAEPEVAAAWKTGKPLSVLTTSTLLASRRSRDVVNAKVMRMRVTHAHLLRAFAAFILLLLLDPLFYALGHPVPHAEGAVPGIVIASRSEHTGPACPALQQRSQKPQSGAANPQSRRVKHHMARKFHERDRLRKRQSVRCGTPVSPVAPDGPSDRNSNRNDPGR